MTNVPRTPLPHGRRPMARWVAPSTPAVRNLSSPLRCSFKIPRAAYCAPVTSRAVSGMRFSTTARRARAIDPDPRPEGGESTARCPRSCPRPTGGSLIGSSGRPVERPGRQGALPARDRGRLVPVLPGRRRENTRGKRVFPRPVPARRRGRSRPPRCLGRRPLGEAGDCPSSSGFGPRQTGVLGPVMPRPPGDRGPPSTGTSSPSEAARHRAATMTTDANQ